MIHYYFKTNMQFQRYLSFPKSAVNRHALSLLSRIFILHNLVLGSVQDKLYGNLEIWEMSANDHEYSKHSKRLGMFS